MGSEAGGSSVGSASTSALDVQTLKPGSDDDGGLEDGRSLLTGLFGVGFAVSKEKSPGWQFTVLKLVLEFLQLWLLVVDPQFGFSGFIDRNNAGWKILSFLRLNQFMADRGYVFYIAVVYTLAVILLCNIVLCAWVGYALYNNNLNVQWPVVWLRWFGRVVYNLLDIASLTVFLIALDCEYMTEPVGVRNYNRLFPDVYCWSTPHVYHACVAGVSLAGFIAFSTFFTMTEMELNPLCKSPFSMSHTKVELYSFGLKTLMTVGAMSITNVTVVAILYVSCMVVQTYLYATWIPHMVSLVNHVRVGTYTAVTYCSVLLLAMAIRRHELGDEDVEKLNTLHDTMTLLMWAGVGPAAIVGAAISHLRHKAFDAVLERFRAAPPGTKTRLIYKFRDPREVEILGRCCRRWLPEDDELLDEEAVQLAESVMKAGLSQLPTSPFMVILYSSFLIDVQTSYQSGYTLLQTAKKKLQDASILERFAIYSREQMHLQKAAATDPTGQVDLVSFVEFQRAHRQVVKVHKEALMAMRFFWSLLLHSSVKFDSLAKAVDKMDSTIRSADRVYKSVLQRHSTSVKLVRLYGKFLEAVKHNPWDASRWFSEADKLEQREEDAKNTSAFADMNGLDPGLRAALTTLGPLTESRAIIIMNAQCIVQLANANVELFGYQKNELKGKNINVLIPHPFCEHHSTYVRNYLVTGKETVIGRTTEFIALHRERFVLAVTLQVTKVSGIGEDTMFLGVFNGVASPPGVAKAWVLTSGVIISVDPYFTDMFGFRPDDLAGAHISTIVESRSYSRLDDTLKTCKAAAIETPAAAPVMSKTRRVSVPPSALGLNRQASLSGPQGGPGSVESRDMMPEHHQQWSYTAPREWILRDVGVKHRFSEVVNTDLIINNGGVGAYKFHVICIQRSSTSLVKAVKICAEEMFVSDRKGRVCHVTTSLATALGTNPRALMAGGAQYAVEALLPPPFNALHRLHAAGIPLFAAPMYSCRSGLSMMLAAQGPNGLTVSPWKMRMSRREAPDDVYHVCLVQQVTMQQAKDERCLTLHVDVASGNIVWASDSPPKLFDIIGSNVVGKSVAEVVDVLHPSIVGMAAKAAAAAGAVGGHEGDMQGIEEESYTQCLLMHLAARAISKPDMSYRVGVLASITGADTFLQQQVPMTRAVYPATMVANVLEPHGKVPARRPDAEARGSMPGSLPGQKPESSVQPKRASIQEAVGVCYGEDEFGFIPEPGPAISLPSYRGEPPPRNKNPSPPPTTFNTALTPRGDPEAAGRPPAPAPMIIELQLWRSELCCSVVEVDNHGMVTSDGADLPLYPPGLVFGTASGPMPGSHISHYLPQTAGHNVTELMDVNSLIGTSFLTVGPEGFTLPGASNEPKAIKAKGGLKSTTLTAADLHARSRTGAIQLCKGRQLGDGMEIEVTMQAVFKQAVHGGPSGAYIVLHPYQPKCGRPDLLAYLQQLREREALRAAAGRSYNSAPWGEKKEGLLRSRSLMHSPNSSIAGDRPSGGPDAPIRSSASVTHMDSGGLVAAPPDGSPGHGLPRRSVSRSNLRFGSNSHLAGAVTSPSGQAWDGSGRLAPEGLPGIYPSEGSFHAGVRPGANGRTSLDVLYQRIGNGVTPHATSGRNKSSFDLSKASIPEGLEPGPGEEEAIGHSPLLENKPKGVRFGGGDTKESRISMWIQTNGEKYASVDLPRASMDQPSLPVDGGPEEDRAISEPASNDPGSSSEEDAKFDNGSAQGSTGREEQRGAVHHDSSDQLDEAGSLAPTTQLETDYRRGQRYKKIARMLASQTVQRSTERWKIQAISLVSVLLSVHLAIFVLLVVVIVQERDGVQHLQNAGLTVRKAGNLAIYTRYLEIIVSKRAVDNPTGLYDLQPTQEYLNSMLDLYKAAYEEVYLYSSKFFFGDPRAARLPTDYGLREMWEGNSIYETNILEVPKPGVSLVGGNVNITATEVVLEQSLTNLWKMSNKIVQTASKVWRSTAYVNETGQDFESWSAARYLWINIVGSYTNNMFNTMSAMLQQVEKLSSDLNTLQITIAGCEGAILTTFLFVWMWIISSKVAEQRYLMYNVFMAVPNGLVRALATKKLDLGEEDDEDDMVDVMGETGQMPAGAQGERRASNMAPPPDPTPSMTGPAGKFKIGMRTAHADMDIENGKDGGVREKSFFEKTWIHLKIMVAAQAPMKVNPGSKRHLKRSVRTTVMLTWPFMLWGCIIVAINIVSFQLLGQISAPLKLFNMVNVVASRYKRDVFYAMEVCAARTPEYREEMRQHLSSAIPIVSGDYDLMLYGKSSLSNDTTLYRDVPEGLMTVGSTGQFLLFNTKECLAPAAFCHNTTSLYYEDTHNGLDRMMRKLFQVFKQTVQMNGTEQPALTGPEFEYLVNTNFDITYGFSTVNADYRQVVLQVYDEILNIHIVAFAFTVAVCVFYVFAIYRPFLSQLSNETKRVAELLSMLPSEMDVEGLMQHILIKTLMPPAPPTEKEGDIDGVPAPSASSGPAVAAKTGSFLGPQRTPSISKNI